MIISGKKIHHLVLGKNIWSMLFATALTRSGQKVVVIDEQVHYPSTIFIPGYFQFFLQAWGARFRQFTELFQIHPRPVMLRTPIEKYYVEVNDPFHNLCESLRFAAFPKLDWLQFASLPRDQFNREIFNFGEKVLSYPILKNHQDWQSESVFWREQLSKYVDSFRDYPDYLLHITQTQQHFENFLQVLFGQIEVLLANSMEHLLIEFKELGGVLRQTSLLECLFHQAFFKVKVKSIEGLFYSKFIYQFQKIKLAQNLAGGATSPQWFDFTFDHLHFGGLQVLANAKQAAEMNGR